jgi:hypothetical protein
MNATSRDSRSSLATITGHLPVRPAESAAASCGRRSSASEPFASFDFNELAAELEALGLGEALDGSPLGL